MTAKPIHFSIDTSLLTPMDYLGISSVTQTKSIEKQFNHDQWRYMRYKFLLKYYLKTVLNCEVERDIKVRSFCSLRSKVTDTC